MIKSVIPAQPQNNGDSPGSIDNGCNMPIKPNDIIAMRINPITSSIFVIIFLYNQKDIWFCKSNNLWISTF